MTAIDTSSITIVSLAGLFLLGVLLVGGIIMMAMRRRDHGRPAVIGIMGCVVLLLGVVFDAARSLLIDLMSDVLGLTPTFVLSTAISLLFSLVGTGLLIWAVVARRDQRQPAPPHGPGWQPPQPPQPGWGQPQQPPFQQQPGWQNPQRPPFNDGS
ncbi:hypothetical protein ETD86_50350 [Nonomuraea turkmeniaca]|uniref:Uncharacterized protein n=1 Tax=Nonomuraea turkmeniaca TaxID=103838 RepID=A0A5S4FFW1_9ACTN|nr:hypothetical protein [Nonomuraea turkmeniaca]TMR07846.1 hypothetical protein ETD86_50350 [Nonomuraea turkmeniaca]